MYASDNASQTQADISERNHGAAYSASILVVTLSWLRKFSSRMIAKLN
jgi:hypothetical protein